MDWQSIGTNSVLGITAFLGGLAYNNVSDTTKENKANIVKVKEESKTDIDVLKDKHNEDFKKLHDNQHETNLKVTKNTVYLEGIIDDNKEIKLLLKEALKEIKKND